MDCVCRNRYHHISIIRLSSGSKYPEEEEDERGWTRRMKTKRIRGRGGKREKKKTRRMWQRMKWRMHRVKRLKKPNRLQRRRRKRRKMKRVMCWTLRMQKRENTGRTMVMDDQTRRRVQRRKMMKRLNKRRKVGEEEEG